MGLPRVAPPRPRQRPMVDTMGIALKRATGLMPCEIAETMAPARACTKRLREGRATEDQIIVLRTQLRIALGIEASGIVRGLRQEFTSALAALDAIADRSMAGGAWRQTALHAQEIADINAAVNHHEFQLRHVSAGELHKIARKLIAQTQSSGGELRHCDAQALGLASG